MVQLQQTRSKKLDNKQYLKGINLFIISIINTIQFYFYNLFIVIKDSKELNVLIYDLGGGTFDVSILTLADGVFEVKATAGDTHLGGSDFDNRMVQHFIEEFKRKTKIDIAGNKRAIKRLQSACERAKRTLSSSMQANVEIDSLAEGTDLYSAISRAKFEDINADLFKATIGPVERALKDSKFDKKDIHEVIVVGGSTRIPKIQSLLQNFFDGKELNKSINPDEAIAYGAAVQAAILYQSDKTDDQVKDLLLLDVAPLSLGIETAGGVMTVIISRNSTIPAKHSQTFSTFSDFQSAVTIDIYEGERPKTKDNNHLGEFTLTGIPPLPRGVPQIEVTFDIDANGILTVTAEDKSTGNINNITITNDKGRLTKDQIDKMVKDAEKYKAEDDKTREQIEIRNKLEAFCYGLKSMAEHSGDTGLITTEEMEDVVKKCNETIMWLQANVSATKEQIQKKLNEMESTMQKIEMKIRRKSTSSRGSTSRSSTSKPPQPPPSSGPKIEELD